MTKHGEVKDSAKATIVRIRSKHNHTNPQEAVKKSYREERSGDSKATQRVNTMAGNTSMAIASRARASKNSQAIDAKERKAAMNAITKKLLLGKISQGTALKELRIQVLGLKQDAFTNLVKVSRKTLSEVENDRGNYTTEVINKLFKPFGLKVGLVPISPHMLSSLLKENND